MGWQARKISGMSAEFFLHYEPELPEWRRSGGYFLFAVALHLAILVWPREPAITMPPPGPLSVKLIEALKARPEPPPVSLPKPPPAVAKPTPRAKKPRPVLAMTPEQQPAVANTPLVAAPVAPDPAPPPQVVASPSPPASRTIVAARFDAAYLQNPEPKYPPLSRRLGEEGKVLLRVRVNADGRAVAVDLEKSSNFVRLDEAARQAVSRWRFVPARRGDEAIEASVIVPLVFRLES